MYIAAFTANGERGIRTLDPLLARQLLAQLSYIPKNLASTYLPVPLPAKYFRPLKS